MRSAIIGCGFIAHLHAQNIKALGHELSVVVGRNPQKAAQFAEKWAIPISTSDTNVALENCDVVHVCTPPMVHFEITKAALEAGKHVLCEKPLTIRPAEAATLLDWANTNKVIGAVNFNVRYHEVCQRARQLIQQESLGKIVLIHGHYLQDFHAGSDVYNWRYQEKEGGPMRATTEIGSHWIDLVRFWTGLEVEAISATFSNIGKKRFLDEQGIWHQKVSTNSQAVEINSEDMATIIFRYANGAIGNVVLSEVSLGRKNQLRLEVVGTQQSIWWDNERPYHLHLGQKNQAVRTLNQPFGGGFTDTFFQLFKDFYQAIEGSADSKNLPSFEDGLINAQICQAIYESANNNSAWTKISNDG